ncbi:MAG: carbamoyltransferase HypF [Gammaproteobacteria bacterium]|nr:carbamoyltransferase HypF [Gammaproteobacteria bacterium]
MKSSALRPSGTEATVARLWRLGGRVQGVGFRPFVYRLAADTGVAGWVRNRGGIVEIRAEGTQRQLAAFDRGLLSLAPPAARPRLLEVAAVTADGSGGFEILSSTADAGAGIHVPPDLFACDDCLAELRDPRARRHRYPFINCTQCGPRYTLIRALPYDRPNTTMAGFPLCFACDAEYRDPLDRRFHAQPLACPACGPQLAWRRDAQRIEGNQAALAACIESLHQGAIVAARGIGGYHLLCDAASESAVARLRQRKHRPAKPLAVMVPWSGGDGLRCARQMAWLSPLHAAALSDPARPIVLAPKRPDALLASGIAPGLNQVGLMLPYSPLHHLLLDGFGKALVATSGNLSGEPVLTDPDEAEARLAHIADAFLHHNRPIQRPADDPVLQLNAGAIRPLRIGRGNAPLELSLPFALDRPLLAVGAFLKNTVALAWDDRVVISPHIGELQSPRSRNVFEQVAQDLQDLYGVRAQLLACDAHPDFPNSRWARASGLPVVPVFHHAAHASAVFGEYPADEAMLCFTWDGVGYGEDGTLWGGEALYGRPGAWRRVASFRPFKLPGGERAVREPWRTALALSWDSGIAWPAGARFDDPVLRAACARGLNSPQTSAVGRLFDAAAAFLDLTTQASFEGEGPMKLEALSVEADGVALPLARDQTGVWRTDWRPLVARMTDTRRPAAERASAFHASLAQTLADQARAIRDEHPVRRIGLAGGVFQNRLLTRLVGTALEAEGFEILIPQQLPLNDAGISFGQVIEAAARLRGSAS